MANYKYYDGTNWVELLPTSGGTMTGNIVLGSGASGQSQVGANLVMGIQNDSYGILPYANNWNQIGASDRYWYRSYITNMNCASLTTTGNVTINGSLVGNAGGAIVGTDDSAFIFQAKSNYNYCNIIFNDGGGTILGNLGFSASKTLQIYDRRSGVTQGWKDVALREDLTSYQNKDGDGNKPAMSNRVFSTNIWTTDPSRWTTDYDYAPGYGYGQLIRFKSNASGATQLTDFYVRDDASGVWVRSNWNAQNNTESALWAVWRRIAEHGDNISVFNNDSGYITSSALNGYATESWVGNNYLPLSGGTLTSGGHTLTVNQTSSDNTGSGFYVNDAGDTDFMRALQVITPNLTAGRHAAISIGKADNDKNQGQITFYYVGDHSTGNMLSFGLHQQDDVLSISGAGNVGIGLGIGVAASQKLQVSGRVSIGNSSNLASPWGDSNLVVGRGDGYDKVVFGYLASNTNGAVVGAHNSALNAWAPLFLGGTSINFSIDESTKMSVTNSAVSSAVNINAPSFSTTVSGNTKATIQYNSNEDCLDFIFS